MSNNPDDPIDMTERIEIFSTDDEKIKSFGELLTNDSSRTILKLIFKNEITANQIAQQTGISLQLVKYHINKMQEMGIAKVAKIEKNSKGQDMKFYTATKFAIVILPSSVKEKAKESKLLVRSFKTIYKFAGVGVASVASFFFSHMIQDTQVPVDAGIKYPRPTLPLQDSDSQTTTGSRAALEEEQATVPEAEPSSEFTSGEQTLEESLELAQRRVETEATLADYGSIIGAENFWPLIVAIAVAGIGLAIIYFWKSYKHSKNLKQYERKQEL